MKVIFGVEKINAYLGGGGGFNCKLALIFRDCSMKRKTELLNIDSTALTLLLIF